MFLVVSHSFTRCLHACRPHLVDRMHHCPLRLSTCSPSPVDGCLACLLLIYFLLMFRFFFSLLREVLIVDHFCSYLARFLLLGKSIFHSVIVDPQYFRDMAISVAKL